MSRRTGFSVGLTVGLILLACQPEKSVLPEPNQTPTAVIGGQLTGDEGTPITFDGSSSSDDDGDSLTYTWIFADGGRASGAVVQHVFGENGSYQVWLAVTDQRGGRDTARAEVTVSNLPPSVTQFIIQSTSIEMGSVAKVLVGFSDPGSSDHPTARLDWGDSSSTPVDSGTTGQHVYQRTGSYIVTLTVQDNDGAVTTKTATSAIVVSPHATHPPVARIQGPATAREGQRVEFSARQSRDVDGDTLSYEWLFGYGGFRLGPLRSQPDLGWAFPDDGVYTVSVIVTDQHGAADTASLSLTIVNTPPHVTRVRAPTQQAVGDFAATTIEFTDSGYVDSHWAMVRWGDGNADSVPVEPDYKFMTKSHSYVSPGLYTASVTVYDNNGGAGSAASTVPIVVFDAKERRTIAGYEVMDLGTLGGNLTRARDLNDRGQIVGSSQTGSGETRAFLWMDGAIRDLGTLGHETSYAYRINNAGLIAGHVRSGSGWDESTNRAVLWSSSGAGRIIESERANSWAALAITTTGDVVWNKYGHESIFGLLWKNDELRPLMEVNGFTGEFRVTDMNERGRIVGGVPTHAWGESRILHASVWEAGTIRDLGVLAPWSCGQFGPGDDCSHSRAMDINDNEQIVGVSSDAAGKSHFVMWTDTIHDLGLIPETPNYRPVRILINNRGTIVATAAGLGMIWRNGAWQSIGSFGGATDVVAMNEDGLVVGTSETSNGEQHVFVWSEGRGMVDLGTGPHPFTAAWAVGINARGDVLGFTAPCRADTYRICGYAAEPRAVLWRKQ